MHCYMIYFNRLIIVRLVHCLFSFKLIPIFLVSKYLTAITNIPLLRPKLFSNREKGIFLFYEQIKFTLLKCYVGLVFIHFISKLINFQFLRFIIIIKLRSNIVEIFPKGLERSYYCDNSLRSKFCLVLCSLGVETPGSFFHLDLVFCTENSIRSAVLLHVVLLLIKFYLFIYFI